MTLSPMPWRAFTQNGDSPVVVFTHKVDVPSVISDDDDIVFIAETVDDAQRAVACVNAMAGISNPEEFMHYVRRAVMHLGNMIGGLGEQFGKNAIVDLLTKAEDAAGGMEQYC